jgi:uncharacterized membrane protein YsdA (DUF1294 family)/cold shock CspA family protein
MESRLNGRLVKWDDERGFGFVSHEDHDRDVFVHINEFRRGSPRPVQGDQLTFRIVQDDERGQCATRVRFANSKEQWSTPPAACMLPGLLYFFAMGLYGFLYGINAWFPVAIFVLSLLAYGKYWHDKRKAQRGEWRTPEQTLHIVSFLGGWPGALIAQWHIRHKNRKLTFQTVFWAVVLANVGLTIWFFMPKWAGPLVRVGSWIG